MTQLDVCSRRLSLAVAEMMVWGLHGASWETLEMWRAGRRQSPKSAVLSHVRLCATQWPGAHQAPLRDLLSKNTGVGFHFLLQGIFLTRGSSPRLFVSYFDRRVLYH